MIRQAQRVFHYRMFNLRRVLPSLIMGCALGALPVAAAKDCEPRAGEVSLFRQAEFGGDCVTLGQGIYARSGDIGLPNDSVSSIKVGEGVEAMACRDRDLGGECQVFTSTVDSLRGSKLGNDRLTSVKIRPVGGQDCEIGPSQVAIFDSTDFLGRCRILDIGTYNHAVELGLPNDSASSVKVGPEVQVMLCKRARLSRCRLALRSASSLRSLIGNSNLTSARVEPLGTQACQPGAGEVAFYNDNEYQGRCVKLPAGRYPRRADLDNLGISSLLVGPGAQACVCRTQELRADCRIYDQDNPDLADYWNDNICSAEIASGFSPCPPQPSPTEGYASIQVTNCHPQNRGIKVWWRVNGGEYQQIGNLPSPTGTTAGVCPRQFFRLESGNRYQVFAVDPELPFCGSLNDPSRRECVIAATGELLGENGSPRVASLLVQR